MGNGREWKPYVDTFFKLIINLQIVSLMTQQVLNLSVVKDLILHFNPIHPPTHLAPGSILSAGASIFFFMTQLKMEVTVM